MKKGFTLIELLVVISIIGILSSVVMSSLNQARIKARDARRVSDLQELQKALEMYYSDNGHYPYDLSNGTGTYADCWAGSGNNWIPNSGNYSWSTNYISKQPQDPVDNCCWPQGNQVGICATAGQAATYEYWSNGSKYLLSARMENLAYPYRAEITGIIDPRNNQPYSTSVNWGVLGKYCYVITN